MARPTRWTLLAFAALACAFAWPIQGGFDNERSHYALVRALADGTPTIDRTRFETGDQASDDVTFWKGHTYSNKAPGLALLSVPVYAAARAVGVPASGDSTRMLWVLSLFGAVLPALVLLLLVRSVSDRIAPGSGTLVAVVLGVATLVLPFATLYYSHVLAASLVFIAFATLFLLRDRRPILAPVLAGTTAGYAATTEYATVLAAGALCAYAACSQPRIRRAAAYVAGFAAGVVPLLAYDLWAFGSPLHFSWAGERTRGGDLPSAEVVTGASPRLEPLLESVFGLSGLVVTMPVVAVSAAGLVLLARRGFRAEAATIAAAVGGFLLFNASFGSGFDSYSGGERYLIAVLPLLLVPLGCALARWPETTVALSLVSALMMGLLTSAHVRVGEPDWLDGLAEHRFPSTALSLVGVTGWYAMLPFFVFVGVALGAGLAGSRLVVRPGEVPFAGVAVLAWATLAASAPRTGNTGGSGSLTAYLPVAGVAVALAVAAVLLARDRPGSSRKTVTTQGYDR